MDCYIALGTNLGNLGANLRVGLDGLRGLAQGPMAQSSVWETEPVGIATDHWFWNMVVRLDSRLEPHELLDRLLGIERRAGRIRGEAKSPRTLDLDLLLMGQLRIEDSQLQLPHPRMWHRRFVLEPLAEIAPGLRDPSSGLTVDQRRRELADPPRVRRLGCLASR
jgi:2-amino-4-hydroxy-6-hydroxymethyldihydropteridine diphosphokinase